MNLLNLYRTNRICPRCKNPNYMVSLVGVSDIFQYKCTNCNSYFTYDDFTSKTSTIKNDMVKVVRCKDCKHRGDKHKCIVAFVADKQDFPICFYDNRGEWYCADGERKENA